MRIFYAVTLLAVACGGPNYVRDTDVKNLDEYAMSTGLDRRDVDRLYDENVRSMMESAVVGQWKKDTPVVAIFPISNETSEHVGPQLDALLSKLETQLVNGGFAQVVSRERQKQLIGEVEAQRGGAFDPSSAATYGKQLGARYFVTGKLHDSAERTEGERRVQYFLFMQVVDVETGVIRWQNEAKLSKGLVK
jgi:penicillin-binding protein activator